MSNELFAALIAGSLAGGGGGNVYESLEAGVNITIEETSDGKAKISASGEVSSEDTVARAAIAEMKDGTNIDSFGDVETALATKADTSSTYTKTEVDTALGNKVDKVSGKGLSTNDFTTAEKTKLDDLAEIKSIGTGLNLDSTTGELTATGGGGGGFTPTTAQLAAMNSGITAEKLQADETALADKVDKVSGKVLSSNDFTNELKSKLDGIASGAEVNVQADWNQTTDSADDYIKNKPTIPTTAADVSAIPTSAKGTASGVAELDSNGKVPSSQLPSYVDDVIEGYYYNSKFYEDSAHTTEITGTTGKIYVDLSTNKTYRWSGSGYTEISESLALGTTSSTAFRGDYGSTAYTHATDSSRSTTAKSSGLYKIASTAQGHIASLTSVQKSDITALGIPAQDTTYTFNTAYNASNNKAATMADIEKGLLPSYVKKTGNVATTDKVVEAIGKLETKADNNDNDIKSAYGGIPSKNVVKQNTVAFTGSRYLIDCDNLTGAIAIYVGNCTSTDTDASTCSMILDYTDSTSSLAQTINRGQSTIIQNINLDGHVLKNIAIYSSDNWSHGTGDTATFTDIMVCSQADYESDSTFQPYSLPNTKITPELIDLVDSGAKNLSPVNSGTATQRYQIDVTLSAGEYMLYVGGLTSTDTDSSTCQIIAMTSSTGTVVSPYVMATRESGKYYSFTLTDTCNVIYVYASDSFAHSSGDTVTFSNLMLCTKAAWDVSQKYVPYGISNAELTSYIPLMKKTQAQMSTDYALVNDVTHTIPPKTVVLINVLCDHNNSNPTGIVVSLSNDSSNYQANAKLLAKTEMAQFTQLGLSTSVMFTNNSVNPVSVYFWVKYAATTSNIVITTINIMGNV